MCGEWAWDGLDPLTRGSRSADSGRSAGPVALDDRRLGRKASVGDLCGEGESLMCAQRSGCGAVRMSHQVLVYCNAKEKSTAAL
jgi:hypothetical protein